jgi:hypothetical protein
MDKSRLRTTTARIRVTAEHIAVAERGRGFDVEKEEVEQLEEAILQSLLSAGQSDNSIVRSILDAGDNVFGKRYINGITVTGAAPHGHRTFSNSQGRGAQASSRHDSAVSSHVRSAAKTQCQMDGYSGADPQWDDLANANVGAALHGLRKDRSSQERGAEASSRHDCDASPQAQNAADRMQFQMYGNSGAGSHLDDRSIVDGYSGVDPHLEGQAKDEGSKVDPNLADQDKTLIGSALHGRGGESIGRERDAQASSCSDRAAFPHAQSAADRSRRQMAGDPGADPNLVDPDTAAVCAALHGPRTERTSQERGAQASSRHDCDASPQAQNAADRIPCQKDGYSGASSHLDDRSKGDVHLGVDPHLEGQATDGGSKVDPNLADQDKTLIGSALHGRGGESIGRERDAQASSCSDRAVFPHAQNAADRFQRQMDGDPGPDPNLVDPDTVAVCAALHEPRTARTSHERGAQAASRHDCDAFPQAQNAVDSIPCQSNDTTIVFPNESQVEKVPTSQGTRRSLHGAMDILPEELKRTKYVQGITVH